MTDTEIVILNLAGEGGEIELRGRKQGTRWQFSLTRDETAAVSLLAPEDAAGLATMSTSTWVEGWDQAMTLLDRYPWTKLRPTQAASEFAQAVLEAVSVRAGEAVRKQWATRLGLDV